MLVARASAKQNLRLGTLELNPTDGLAWSQVLAQSENLLPEPESPLTHLDSPYNRRDNCRVRQARLHSPCGLAEADEHVPLMNGRWI